MGGCVGQSTFECWVSWSLGCNRSLNGWANFNNGWMGSISGWENFVSGCVLLDRWQDKLIDTRRMGLIDGWFGGFEWWVDGFCTIEGRICRWIGFATRAGGRAFSSTGRASDRHATDAVSIPRFGEGFFSKSHLSVQNLLRVSVHPHVQSHALTSVRKLKIL